MARVGKGSTDIVRNYIEEEIQIPAMESNHQS
jgi:hypothetical protein